MKRRPPETPTVEGIDLPAEFMDKDAVVWHDDQAWREFVAARGWNLDYDTRLVDSQEHDKEMVRQGAQISPDPFTHYQWQLPTPFARRRWACHELADEFDIPVGEVYEAVDL